MLDEFPALGRLDFFESALAFVSATVCFLCLPASMGTPKQSVNS